MRLFILGSQRSEPKRVPMSELRAQNAIVVIMDDLPGRLMPR